MKERAALIAEIIHFTDPRTITYIHKKWIPIFESISENEAIHCESLAIKYLDDIPRGEREINEYLTKIIKNSHQHDWSENIINEYGFQTYKCSGCDEIKYRKI